MRYRFILFDLDGTLVDSYDPLVSTINETLEAHKLPLLSSLDLQEGLYKIYHKRAHLADPKTLRETHLKLQHKHLHRATLYSHVLETLQRLRDSGVHMAVVTTCNIAKAKLLMSTHGLDPFFKVIITEADVANIKPHKEPFEKATKALGAKNLDEVLMVGDGIPDIEGAHGYGIHVAAVTYSAFGIRVRDYKPTYTIDRFDELLPIIGIHS